MRPRKRGIEPMVEKWAVTPASIVLIRGHRRSGKSSTIQRVLRRLGKPSITLYVKDDEKSFVDSAVTQLKKISANDEVNSYYSLCAALLKVIKGGSTVVLEEIQNATMSLQVSLQELFDSIAFLSMQEPNNWRTAGCVFLMGSPLERVDHIFENRKSPLFQRVYAKITVHSFDTLELVRFVKHANITKPSLILSLHSLFGGWPFPYHIAWKAGLLCGDDSDLDKIVKEFFASELQSDFNDASCYYEKQFGPSHAVILKALGDNCGTGKKTQQMKQAMEKSEMNDNEVLRIVNNELQYGIVAPMKKMSDLCTISEYRIIDPLCRLVGKAPAMTERREDVTRTVAFQGNWRQELEGMHLEEWIVEIAEDRQKLLQEPALPGLDPAGTCQFLRHVVWDLSGDIEIDLVGCQLHSNTLLLGSCKRSETKINCKNLLDHFDKLKEDKCMPKLLKVLGLKENYKVCFYHFTTEVMPSASFSADVRVVSLRDMLEPFFAAVHLEPDDDDNDDTELAASRSLDASLEQVHAGLASAGGCAGQHGLETTTVPRYEQCASLGFGCFRRISRHIGSTLSIAIESIRGGVPSETAANLRSEN